MSQTQAEAAESLFFDASDLSLRGAAGIVADALQDCDDGELFLEYGVSESLALDDGRIRSASTDTTQGFGLRAVAGEAAGYAHGNVISRDSLTRAAQTVRAVRTGQAGTLDLAPGAAGPALYGDQNPLLAASFEDKVALLSAVDAYARRKDSRVRQVMASLAGSWTTVMVLRSDGSTAVDVRPLVRLNVTVVAGDGDRQETGSTGLGGRHGIGTVMGESTWQGAVDEALRQALVNLEAVDAPAGPMTVVLGPGWPGVLLHEAVGHGLEGDFNRKGTSAFAGRIGERVAAPGVTVVDDGAMAERRGSLTMDDEGTATGRTVLIEDGILVGYLQDRMNARLMGMAPTGNGRRESYAHLPMPRMTNTFMENGDRDPAEILASVEKGLYAVNFGGGQVDITSGKFVFSASEAYLVENGKITAPVHGATLIGHGPEAMTRVSMIGNDMALDPGIGVCGKAGQGVPVGVGQPTLRIDGLTVGGTQAA